MTTRKKKPKPAAKGRATIVRRGRTSTKVQPEKPQARRRGGTPATLINQVSATKPAKPETPEEDAISLDLLSELDEDGLPIAATNVAEDVDEETAADDEEVDEETAADDEEVDEETAADDEEVDEETAADDEEVNEETAADDETVARVDEEEDVTASSEPDTELDLEAPPASGPTSISPGQSDEFGEEPAAGEDESGLDELLRAEGEAEVVTESGPDVTDAVSGELLGADGSANDTESFLKTALEAILFVADKPLSIKDIAKAIQLDRRRAEEILESLRTDYEERGFRIDAVADGYCFRSNPKVAEYVRAFLEQKPVKLSRAQLETLAIVAYRQPITRPEADDVRGVDCGPVLKGLLERELIRVLGKKDEPGRPMLYGTTPAFLELFGLKSLEELPTLKEFTELNDDSRRKFEQEMGEEAPVNLSDLGLTEEEPTASNSSGDAEPTAAPEPVDPKAYEDPSDEDEKLSESEESDESKPETSDDAPEKSEEESADEDEDDEGDEDEDEDDEDDEDDDEDEDDEDDKDDEDDEDDDEDDDDDDDDDEDDDDDDDDDDDEDEDEDEDEDDDDEPKAETPEESDEPKAKPSAAPKPTAKGKGRRKGK